MAEQTCDDSNRECPYCGHSYQPESEDYSNDTREEECSECGKKYIAHDSFSVTHYATPDCELNGEQHDWQPRPLPGGRTHPFCERCDRCQPHNYVTPNAAVKSRRHDD